MKLIEEGESLAYEIAFWMQGLDDPNYPLEELGQLSIQISRQFRALAIINLVAQSDSDHFFHNLIRSGRARATYLSRIRQSGRTTDYHYASGRCEALLDAISAGELGLARRIASLSPGEFQEGREYEDDYCYAQILIKLIQTPPLDMEVSPLLERFAAYLEGKSDGRLEVCRSLLTGKQAEFDLSFASLLEEREGKIFGDENRGQLEDVEVIAERRVFVEGLALLRLAEMRGLSTEREYKYCPSLARVQMKAPFPGA